MRARFALLLGGALAPLACNVYDPSLLGTGGAGGSGGAGPSSSSATTSSATGGASTSSTTTTSTSSTTGTGASTSSSSTGGCNDPSECPGTDGECQQRTCTNGVCGIDYAGFQGKLVQAQTPGDCLKEVCDGQGGTTQMPDDADLPDDGKQCTDDGCSNGTKTFTPKASGIACSDNGGKVCSSAGDCVECNGDADCGANVCNASNACVAPTCTDNKKDGSETDTDCGGGTCLPCATGLTCGGNTDCKGGLCSSGTCAPTCTDGQKNNAETDADCGGGTCPACTSGKMCGGNTDCLSGKCVGGVCESVLLLSEIRTRGSAAGNDELIEIYNPTPDTVTFDSTWEVWGRNGVNGTCQSYAKRFSGTGQIIPPYGHLLYVGSAYDDGVPADGTYASGLVDAAQVVLLKAGVLADSVCFHYSATTQNNLLAVCNPPLAYPCGGMGVSNLPHNNSSGNTDVSIERKPGGGQGNGQDTDDDTADWTGNVASTPQNTASAPTP